MKKPTRPRWRRTIAMLAAVGLVTVGLAGAQAATARPAFAAVPSQPSQACQDARISLSAANKTALVVCTIAGLEGGANPFADAACLVASTAATIAVIQKENACSASNAQNVSDNISADPGIGQAALAAAGDTNPQPGDVVDTTIVSYDGQDSSGNYDYTLDITGWEDQATWTGGSTEPPPDSCNAFLSC